MKIFLDEPRTRAFQTAYRPWARARTQECDFELAQTAAKNDPSGLTKP